jgi:hypothetical protein
MTNPANFDLMGVILWRELHLSLAQVQGLMAERRVLAAHGKRSSLAGLALAFRLVTRDQAARAGQLYRRLSARPGAPKPLGYSLLEAGLVSGERLMNALDDQQRSGARLGAILVERGWISADQLAMFLMLQRSEGRALAA